MSKKKYADECIERASMATDGPWLEEGIAWILKVADTDSISAPKSYRRDGKFISHARTDVPELARRLKKACEFLRSYTYTKDLLKELEAPLGKKE